MPEVLAAATAADGLYYLVLAALMGGIVRGFSGFGTALVYMPIAAKFLDPFEALVSLVVMDVLAPLMHVPRALRDGQPIDVGRLAIGATVGVIAGVWILTQVSPDVFRWIASIVALSLLGLLLSGVRYTGPIRPPMLFGAGGLGGILTGIIGAPGPPVIILYMASHLRPAAIRANLMLFLIAADAILITVIWLSGNLIFGAVGLGLLLTLPYLVGNWAGARLFQPEAERLYRTIAYVIIAGSAILGLPVWD